MTAIVRHQLYCEWCTAVTTVDVGLGYAVVDGGMGLLHAGREAPGWVVLQLPVDGSSRVEVADAWVKRLRVACPEHRPILAEFAKELWVWSMARSNHVQTVAQAGRDWAWEHRQPVLELPESKVDHTPPAVATPPEPEFDLQSIDHESRRIEATGSVYDLFDVLLNGVDVDDAMAENSHGVMHATNGWTILLNGEYLPELEA